MGEEKTYTAKDFQRYHAGTMSAEEMHALEKTAMADPFLADALDGYALTDMPAEDLTAINERLNNKQNPKVLSLRPVAGWWRIAALLITVLGGAYLVYTLSSKKPAVDLAINKNPEPAAVQSAPQTDSVSAPQLQPVSEASAETSVLSNSTVTQTAPAGTTSNRAFTNSIPAAAPAEKELFLHDMAAEKDARLIDGNVPEINSDADLKKVSITSAAVAKTAMNSDSAFFALQKPVKEETQNQNVAEEEYKKFNGMTAAVDRVQTEQQSVTTALGRNAKARKSALPPGTETIQAQNESFTLFAQANQRAVFDNSGKRTRGEVALTFDTDKNGTPKNIAISRSTCLACEAEAKRLLQEGPRQRVAARQDSVTIRF